VQYLQCKAEFESKRGTAKYCSPYCRVKASRVSVTDFVSVTETSRESPLSVTKPLSVTEKEVVSVTDLSVTPRYLGKDIHLDRDNPKSIIYDVSEAGFIRRNKAWHTHKESYREMIRAGAIRRKAERIEHVAEAAIRRGAVKYNAAHA